jgi:hypothetical protein
VRSGDRAEIMLDAEYTLDITQAGEVISTRAEEHVTADRIELTSTVTVGGEERYRRTWERSWRAP